jgi:PAS domain S-box-containing protein
VRTVLWNSANVLASDHQTVVATIAQGQDITERKQAEEALRESHARLEKVLEVETAGVMFWDLTTGRMTDANDTFLKMMGYSRREVDAGELTWQKLTPPEYVEASLAEIRKFQATGRVGPYEKEYLRKDGTRQWLLFAGSSLGGNACVEFCVDVADRKQAEEAVRALNASLESKVAQRTVELEHRARQLQKLTLEISQTEDRERKRMAEILHDDLQQQLAATKFRLSVLRSRAKSDASLQAIAAQIDQMLMEAIQKSRSLSHELSPTVLHHDDFVETLRWLANEVQAKHGLLVHVRAAGEVRTQSEPLKGFLYRAAQELLFNVVKHAGVNEAHIRIRRRDGHICLVVSDGGRGFDPQQVRKTAGCGLLSIQERIELLGGRMKIKSAPGRGSRFSIVVPDGVKAEGPVGIGPRACPPSDNQAEKEGGHGGPPLRVLLADDHEIVREGFRSLLSDEHDVEVVGEAANGREAVDLANQLKPDVIVMDMSMPVIDGDAATRQIKLLLPQVRVIAVSMYDQPEKMEAMYKAGAERYVLKTAPSQELLAAIRGRSAGGS